jgi:hypothetical protein
MSVRCIGEKVYMIKTIPHAPNLVFALYFNTAPQFKKTPHPTIAYPLAIETIR